jgi:hypothetical protein
VHGTQTFGQITSAAPGRLSLSRLLSLQVTQQRGQGLVSLPLTQCDLEFAANAIGFVGDLSHLVSMATASFFSHLA